MKTGIAGIGGIGSNVARHLAQAGVTAVKIVDFDCVEASNLNRQFYLLSQVGNKKIDALEKNLKEICPGMVIDKIDRKIRPGDAGGLFSDCEVVVDGLDQSALKKMLVEDLCDSNKIIVSASGIAGTDMSGVITRKMGNGYIVGDLVSDAENEGLFGPKITLVAAVMAGIVLNHIRKNTT